MTKNFSHTFELPHPVERVFEFMTDPKLVTERYEAVGYNKVSVSDWDGETLVVKRDDPSSLPGPLAKLAPGGVSVQQTDVWEADAGDGSRTSAWTVESGQAPMEMSGALKLTPSGEGTTLLHTGSLKVKIPLVGGKAEGVALGQIAKRLEQEWEWIAEQP